MQLLRPAWAVTAAAVCILLLLLLHNHILREGQLAAGTCEIVTLDRDSSQPRRTIARQTARCACRKGQIAGTTRARPACVEVRIVRSQQWCEMTPCLDDEGCDLLVNQSGWTCTQPGGRVKTTTVRSLLTAAAMTDAPHIGLDPFVHHPLSLSGALAAADVQSSATIRASAQTKDEQSYNNKTFYGDGTFRAPRQHNIHVKK
ncbi:chemokine-like protein TAFA-5 [Pleuronectes platessa]|uniref:chemokine-like protein TAFA-5 n=1 Tax=Pleuronectes platessa TaxID=8262 RepID=UPI00232A1479|nr:chemokine-like protein TAFA-5 [Pleuronectes platessa]